MKYTNFTKENLISKIKKLEKEISESKEITELTFEKSAVGIAHVSGNGKIIRVNKRVAQMFGYSIEEMTDMDISLLGNLDDANLQTPEIKKVWQGKLDFFMYEKRYYRKDKSIFWCSSNISLAKTSQGQPSFFIVVLQDISDRIKVQEIHRKSEEKYSTLVENSNDGIIIHKHGKIVYSNPVVEKTIGYKINELVGKDILSFVSPDYHEAIIQRNLARFAGEVIPSITEIDLIRKDGTRLPVEINSSISNYEGAMAMIIFIRNISERKIAENKLKESEYKLKEAQNLAHIGHWDLDIVNDKLEWSDEIHRILGTDPTKFKSYREALLKIIHPDDIEFVNKEYAESIKNKTNYDITHRIILPNGKIRYLRDKCKTTYDDSGNAIRSLGTMQDISELKFAEDALRSITAKFSSVSGIEFIEKVCHHITENLNVEYAFVGELLPNKNKVNVKAGYGKGKPLQSFEYDLADTPCEKVIEESVCSFPTGVQDLFPKDHLLIEMDIEGYVGVPLFSHSGNVLGIMVLLDSKKINDTEIAISLLQIFSERVASEIERIRVEEEFRESEKKSIALLNTTLDEAMLIDKNGEIIAINTAMAKAFNQTPDKMLGTIAFDLLPLDLANQRKKKFEEATKSGKVVRFVDQRADRWSDNSIYPIFDENRNISQFAIFSHDITEGRNRDLELRKRHSELKRLSNELSEKNRMLLESKDRFREIFDQSPVSLWEEDFSKVKQLLNEKKAEKVDLKTYLDTNLDFVKRCTSQVEILNVNEKTLELFGVKSKEELLIHLKKTNNKKSFDVIKREFLSLASGENEFIDEAEFVRTNGEVISTIIKSAKNDSGKTIVSLVDITALKKTKKRLQERETSLLKSQKIAKLGSYYLDVPTYFWKCTPTMDEIFGIDKEYPRDIQSWLKIIHPDDEAMMADYFTNFVLKQKNAFNKEYRIKKINNKQECWVHGMGELEFNNEGNPVRMAGTIQDITERKNNEQELIKVREKVEESEKKFRELYEKSGDAILIIKNGLFVDCNKATVKMLNYKSKNEFLNSHPSKLSPELQPDGLKSQKKAEEMMALSLSNGAHRFEWMHTKNDGTIFPVEVLLTAISNEPDNKIIHVVWRDITERKIGERTLIEAKEKAEESDRLKTEFLNNMSHEIRTPMNGILGFSQLLNDPKLDEQKRDYYVKIVQNSGTQLLRIIDDIIEISRLGTKQIKAIEEEVCLNDLLLELFSIFDIKAKENKTPLYLEKELLDEKSVILTDKTKLNKIISNLLENALKFTNSGSISFGYHLKGKEIIIYVKDTGIGIKKEKLETIFTRFSQGEKELSKKVGGLGLGLAIAKENTELLGGKISVESEINGGSIFSVTIPYKPGHTVAKIDKDMKSGQKKQTILIVEDEEVNFMFIEILLLEKLKINCNIIHAKNGQEAVDICKNNANINLSLMDLKMPVMNGFEATKLIKEFRPDLPIIAQSAYTTVEDRNKALNAGCDDFISKPISKEVLKNSIKDFIKVKI